MNKKIIVALLGIMCFSGVMINAKEVHKQVPTEKKCVVYIASGDPGIPDPLSRRAFKARMTSDPGIPDPLT